MDKKHKRTEALKKIDKQAVGDLKKNNEKPHKKHSFITRVPFPDRGDSRSPNPHHKQDKARLNLIVNKKLTTHGDSAKNSNESCIEKPPGSPARKNSDKNQQELKDVNKEPKEVELRKRIRDKYTYRLKSINRREALAKAARKEAKLAAKNDDSKNDKNVAPSAEVPKKQVVEISTQTKEKSLSSTSSSEDDKKKQPERKHRKPIIKTIMSKNGSVRIYKAVTFVDEKKNSLTHLEINIPPDTFQSLKPSKHTDISSFKGKLKGTVSPVSIKDKPPIRKKDRKRERRGRPVPSPNLSYKGTASPPTEVAKWAPSCLDNLTKPYYEAWVNTTLAATSKNSRKDRLFYERQRENILKKFRRALERPYSPSDLFYENFADEKYTGKIKIRQR